MAVTDWIDTLSGLWGELTDGHKNVRSYKVFTKAEWPGSLSRFPCALSRVVSVSSEYSASISHDYYVGVTELHLTSDRGMEKIPYCMAWYARIRDKAAANLKLGGLVDEFRLRRGEGSPSIEGPLGLKYDEEPEHWGLLIHWTVKELVTVTVSA